MQPFDPSSPGGAERTPDLEPLEAAPPPAPTPLTPMVPAFGAGAIPEPPSARRAAGTREGQNRIAGLATVLLIVVLAFGAGIGVGRATAPAGSGMPAGATPAPSGAVVSPGAPPAASPVAAWYASLPSDGALLGRADAKFVITYWADYQCPFCSKFAMEVLPQLASRIADGTVAIRHRDFAFIGAESFDAAVAVRCGGEQNRYWQMHDAVYAAQAGENQGGFAPAKLAAVAASVGLDSKAYSACIARDDVFTGVLADTSAGVRVDVRSTPSIDVAGRRFPGVTDVPAFLAAVDAAATAAAAGATPVPMPTAAPSNDPWLGTATAAREAGAATAPVTVQIWTDYQVTAMTVLPNDLEPELRKRIAAGKVRLELHDLALGGAESVAAAVMVRCTADQNGRAWFVHDVLSVSAQGPDAGIFTSRNLLLFGARLGLDIDALSACIANPAIAAQVAADTAQGKLVPLSEAPALVILVGSREVARFSGALDVAKVLAAVDAAK